MGKSKKKKQQKLSTKRTRKAAKRKTAGSRSRQPLSSQLSAVVASYPIHETLISDSLFEIGMGTGIFTRLFPDGHIGLSFFLLDVFCLGVKDAHYAVVSMEQYHEFKAKTEDRHPLVEIEAECLVKLVLEVVDYASNLGFPPQKDDRKAKKIFGTMQGNGCDQTFQFGKDGKPFYISGPNDTPAKIARIQGQLERSVGVDGFYFMYEIDEEHL